MKNLLMIMLLIVCANAYCQTEAEKVNQLNWQIDNEQLTICGGH